MLIKLTHNWYVDAHLVTAVRYLNGYIHVYFRDNGATDFAGSVDEFNGLADRINKAQSYIP